jgi:hypothetical protein
MFKKASSVHALVGIVRQVQLLGLQTSHEMIIFSIYVIYFTRVVVPPPDCAEKAYILTTAYD